MIEQEVKFGPKTGLEAVQKREHAVVGMASSDDKTQALSSAWQAFIIGLLKNPARFVELIGTPRACETEA